MVKARDILFKIAFIFAIIAIVAYAIGAIALGLFGIGATLAGAVGMSNSNASLGASMDSYSTSTSFIFPGLSSENEPEVLLASGIMMISFSIVLFVLLILAIVNTVIIKKASNRHTKGLYIAAIVFGFLSGNEFGAVAAIFGLIVLNKNENTEKVEATE